MRPPRLFSHSLTSIVAALLGATGSFAETTERAGAGAVEVFISVPDQSLAVLRDGEMLGKFRVSTSKFGLGDSFGSYKTPVGDLRVCDKVGGGLPVGSVLSGRHATGEVLAPNAPGRDPIVTRILWLEGCEAANQHARSRGIYIHGTAEEKRIGKPVSYGCIRMRSADVVKVYELTPVGSIVRIDARKLSAMTKPRIEDRETRLAAEREAAKAGRIAAEKAERETKAAGKLLAKNSPPPAVAGGPAAATKAEEKNHGEPKTLSMLDKVGSKLMKGSILDYDVFERGDTVPMRGGEVQFRADAAMVAGPPVSKKLTASRGR